MALAIVLIGWGGAWLWIKGQIEHDLDARASRLNASGGKLTWSARRVSGYPFRFDVDFRGVTWRGPDGWGVSAPELRSESSIFAFGHWVAYASAGVGLIRPAGGMVWIKAQVLRASVADTGGSPPDFSLEGQGLTFTPVTRAKPYLLASADQLHIHTRAGPSDQGAFLFGLEGARASPGTRLAAVAGGSTVNLGLEVIYDHADAMAGLGLVPTIRSWKSAGGEAQIQRLSFRAGAFEIEGQGTCLALDQDGRLVGELDLSRGGSALAALATSRASQANDTGVLSFRAGHMTIGSSDLGRSPKVY